MSITLFLIVIAAYVAIAGTVIGMTALWINMPGKEMIARDAAVRVAQDDVAHMQWERKKREGRVRTLYDMPVYRAQTVTTVVHDTDEYYAVSFNKH